MNSDLRTRFPAEVKVRPVFLCDDMKKATCLQPAGIEPGSSRPRPERESVWCETFGYFIDLDACRARSYTKSACRRCYKSLLQSSLPFE